MTNINYTMIGTWRNSAREMASLFKGLTLESPAEDITAAFTAAGVVDRDSYLAWREKYREFIKGAEELQRAIKRDKDLYQWRDYNADLITRVIEVRRASKIAAGAQRRKALEEAA